MQPVGGDGLPSFALEEGLWARGLGCVAGIDEVGVGPLAGPVVAAAVVLCRGGPIAGVNDSKRLSPQQREEVAGRLRAVALGWALGAAQVAEIDGLGIAAATRLAKQRALARLLLQLPEVQHVLVDGQRVAGVALPQTAVIGGDGLSQSIAAASVLAKVARDGHMRRQDVRYPAYGFARHKGYGTAHHMRALARHGPCPLHRRSFRPVAQAAAAAAGLAGGPEAASGPGQGQG